LPVDVIGHLQHVQWDTTLNGRVEWDCPLCYIWELMFHKVYSYFCYYWFCFCLLRQNEEDWKKVTNTTL